MLRLMSPLAFAKRSLYTLQATRHSPLPEQLKREVGRAARLLDRSSSVCHGTASLLGYNISFRGEANFRYLFDEIFLNAAYLFKTESDRPLIFDCGSNIGISVLFFKKLYPRARIVAFEPDPETFSVLNHNIRQNGLTDIETHRIALGSKNGTSEFYRDQEEHSSSLVMSTNRERHPGRQIKVPVRPLSDFIESDIDLLKIDIEGAELEVIEDLAKSGKIHHAQQMHLEYHHHIGKAPDNLSSLLRILEGEGFGYQISAQRYLLNSQILWNRGAGLAAGAFQDVSLYCYKRGT
jgi:FkbM family methyltransferase